MATPEDVATFMLGYMRNYGFSIPYRQVLYAVKGEFGDEFIVRSAKNRDNLSPAVTKAFRELNDGHFEWQAPRQRWRVIER